jgi:16S rRNA (cytosine967-C5)-methyltransferase
MCAAPGSKTAHLAALMNNEGTIDAIDLHPHRIQLLEEGMRRLGVTNVKAQTGDVLQYVDQVGEARYDRILLDAPCSGFGVIRRKPDLLLRTKQEQMDELLMLQQKMLQTAVRLLKPGGVMVYSTCTLNRKENQLQVQALCQNAPSMHLESERQIFPFEYDSDGFYLAKLTKEIL